MNVKKMVFTVIVASTFMASAQATNLHAGNNTALTELCMTAVSGNRAALHNKIKESGYTKNYIAKNVQCNGSDIISFIEQHGKNTKAMIHTIDRHVGSVKITDLAMNRKKR